MEWQPEQIDEFLNLVLTKNSKTEYERSLVAFGQKYGRGATISLREGDQLLRRRANSRTEYAGPASENSRNSRAGFLWSWVEERVLRWSQKSNSENDERPTNQYLAVLFQRTEEEVRWKLHTNLVTKHGITGFDLESQAPITEGDE